jgi:hypothetical protein
MLARNPVGRNAAPLKYDILSALGVRALAADKHTQRLILRLMVLITTRYNWQSGELSIGRAEMARLWSVDERTVKRETAKLRAAGWLSVKRAGVKGRVTVYEIDLAQVLGDTAMVWDSIGPDFAARMAEGQGAPATPEAPADPKVIPFQRSPFQRPAPSAEGEGLWGRVLAALTERDPGTARAWFGQLTELEVEGGTVTLLAPTRFVADYVTTHLAARLLAGYGRFDGTIRAVKVVTA